jgi:predicted DNA-binding protein (MmcQ/YjbR family)
MTPSQQRAAVRERALSFPQAWPDSPWGEGDEVVKVRKKIFVFLGGEQPGAGLSLKLRQAHGHAMSLPLATPTGYGLGRHGWVSLRLDPQLLPLDLLLEWVEESYRIVAPKTLSAQLDAR